MDYYDNKDKESFPDSNVDLYNLAIILNLDFYFIFLEREIIFCIWEGDNIDL